MDGPRLAYRTAGHAHLAQAVPTLLERSQMLDHLLHEAEFQSTCFLTKRRIQNP